MPWASKGGKISATVLLSCLLPASPQGLPSQSTVWCSVPNYRFYRFTPVKARGFPAASPSDCNVPVSMPDGCACSAPEECRSWYCAPGPMAGGVCSYPIVQVSEVEFWRAGRPVPLAAGANGTHNGTHDAFRILNSVDVSATWGVWELEFYHDTACSRPIAGGEAIASSERSRGFGHVDGGAGGPDPAWQSTHEVVEGLEFRGRAALAFDGDLGTGWWAACARPCRASGEWLGRRYAAPPGPLRCIRVAQPADGGHAAARLTVQAHGPNGWETLAEAAARPAGPAAGPWLELSLPQGAAFPAGAGHARLADGDLRSSAAGLAGAPLDFDFGTATEIDAWRWATAEEPLELAAPGDALACAHDGPCPRDPVRWDLEGSSDRAHWVLLQRQSADFPVAVYRRQFVPFQPVRHEVSLTVDDIWPDGRSTCASRR